MPEIRVPYGKDYLTAQFPESYTITSIVPKSVEPAPHPLEMVNQAIASAVGGIVLSQFKDVKTVAIAVNDKTRPVPHSHLLPPLLGRLETLGILPENITLVIATGTHPVMPPEEYTWILPDDIIARYPIICHDSDDKDSLVYLGDTARGTPVWVNKQYMNADLHLAVGNVEPHQFMGFSGGVKSVAIGVAGKQTINHNHSMMTDHHARLGEYHANPARQDVEEIGRMIRVDFVVNALLNAEKKIVEVIAGEPVAVMREAIPRVREIFQVEVSHSFDLVIASPGGYPKDLNVYQAQKALAHATLITKVGGTVILVAECPEGTGSDNYEKWITHESMITHDSVFERFESEGFHIGPHKAFQLSRDASKVRVLFVSSLEADFVKKLLLNPAESLQGAVDFAIVDLDGTSRIGVLPVANATIPMLTETDGAN